MIVSSIFVKSPEEWKELSSALDADGIKWVDGDKLTEWSPFEMSREVAIMDKPSFVFEITENGECHFYVSSCQDNPITVDEYLADHNPETFNNKISIEDILKEDLL